MVTRGNALFYAWAAIALLAIVNVAVFDGLIIAASDTLQVQYMPDDAFYYLGLARNWSTWRTWTFDGGQSVTTGFHPLWAYLLALLFAVAHPTSVEFVRWSLALGSALTIAALSIAWRVGLRLRRPSLMASLALLVTSGNLVLTSVSGMESSLLLLISVLYWMQFVPRRSPTRETRGRGKWGHVAAFTLGLLGSLARSDFGLLALSLFAACLAVRLVTVLPPGQAAELAQTKRRALWGLAGAAVGLLLVFGQTYAIAGGLLQSSARMKAYWGTIYGSAHWWTIKIMLGLLFPSGWRFTDPQVWLYGLLVVLGLFAIWRAWRNQAPVAPRPEAEMLVLLTASMGQLLGSLIVYSRSGSVMFWYSTTAIVPILVLASTASSYLHSLQPKRYLAWISSGIVLLIAALNVGRLYPIGSDRAPMPHQQFALRAGQDLAQRELDGTVGAWNAGIIGYYQGGTVVNLDGLVNDGIYPWVIENDLLGYLAAHDIRYVIDFQNAFEGQQRQQRGGFYGVNLLDRLEPVEVYDRGEYNWKQLTLYRVVSP